MYFRYGNYTFPANTVRLESVRTDPLYDGLMPIGQKKTWSLYIKLYAATLGELNTKIAFMDALFSVEGQVAALLDANRRVTAHILGVGARAGCKATIRPSYEPAVGIEMSKIRSFRVELTAEYDVAIPGLVVRFNETTTIQGDGGPEKDYLECVIGRPIPQTLKQFTKVVVTQTGTIVGRYRRVYPEEWVQEALPGFRVGSLCSVSHGTAELRDGPPGNPVERNFPINYTWVFKAPGFINPRLNRWRN